jgi:hypothetical protein
MKTLISLSLLSCGLWLSGCARGVGPLQLATQQAVLNATTPIVVSTSPSSDVGLNRYIFAKFSMDMDASTINPSTFTVAGLQGTVRYDAKNRIAYFTPAGMLAQNKAYNVHLSTGIKASTGEPMPEGYSFVFRTRTTTDASTPTAHLENTGCVKPDGTVDVMFDEPMDSTTINTTTFVIDGVTGTVSYNTSNRIASFTPSTPFTANTTYSGTITTGAADLGGVHLAADYKFTFTVCPVTTGKGYCSYTKGGYAHEGTPGQFFDQHFSQVFFGDLIIGVFDGNGSQTSARWTAANAGPADLKTYLTSPAKGPSAAFPNDATNPTATVNGDLPSQVATLALNIGFSGVGGTPTGFGDQVLENTGTSLDGASVSDILGFANYALAGDGLPQGYTFSNLNDLVTNLNESWDNCSQDGWASTHLQTPVTF